MSPQGSIGWFSRRRYPLRQPEMTVQERPDILSPASPVCHRTLVYPGPGLALTQTGTAGCIVCLIRFDHDTARVDRDAEMAVRTETTNRNGEGQIDAGPGGQ